jgi:3',5'-nucleoside bisphosphate phosphatase
MTPDASTTVDIHCHTWWSFDGFASFPDVHRWQRDRGVVILAITDHDTLDGWGNEGNAMAGARAPWVVPGLELTCIQDGLVPGILGIGIAPSDSSLGAFLREEAAIDSRELEDWCSCVRREFGVDMARVLAEWADRLFPDFPGRSSRYVPEWVRKRLLVQAGVASTPEAAAHIHESVQRQLPPRTLPAAGRVLDLVHAAGGLAFLEHPPGEFPDAAAATLLRQGLDGVEAYSGHLSEHDRDRWIEFCAKNRILAVAGSDHHGVRGDWGRAGLACPHPKHVALGLVERLRSTRWGKGHARECAEMERALG